MDYMKKFPYWGILNIRCHGTKFCQQHDQAPKICALLRYFILMYTSLQTFIWRCVFLLGERTWMLCDLLLILNFMKIIELLGWWCTDELIWYVPVDSCCHTYCASLMKYSGGNYVCSNRQRVTVSSWNKGNRNLGENVTIVILTLYWLLSERVWLALFSAWSCDQISPLKRYLCNFVLFSWV